MIPAPAPLYSIDSLRRSVKSLTVELLSVYEELAMLYSLSGQIGRLLDEHEIAAVALKEAIEISTADCGWVALWDGDKFHVHDACRMGIDLPVMERINQDILEPLFQSGKHSFLSNSLKKECKPSAANVPGSFLASALMLDNRSRGYLCLGRHGTGSVFLSREQKLISAVGLLMAVEIKNVRLQHSVLDKQRLVNELELARVIQQSLSPSILSCLSFLDAAGANEPCHEIGGDFFDLIPVGPNLCMLVIADVAGKGPPAALQAAMVQGIVNGVSRTCPDVPTLMSTLNECLLSQSTEGHFVTAFAALLSSTGRLQYSNGGHTSALWIRRTGDISELTQGGPLLGVFPGAPYSQASLELAPGDLLVIYTDGIIDTHDAEGNAFGETRLLDWARQQAGRLPNEVKDSLLAALASFGAASRGQDDDRSVLVVRYTGSQDATAESQPLACVSESDAPGKT